MGWLVGTIRGDHWDWNLKTGVLVGWGWPLPFYVVKFLSKYMAPFLGIKFVREWLSQFSGIQQPFFAWKNHKLPTLFRFFLHVSPSGWCFFVCKKSCPDVWFLTILKPWNYFVLFRFGRDLVSWRKDRLKCQCWSVAVGLCGYCLGGGFNDVFLKTNNSGKMTVESWQRETAN